MRILKIDDTDGVIANKDIIREKIRKSEINITFSDENQNINVVNFLKSPFLNESIVNSKIINSSIGYFYLDGFSGGNITVNQIKKMFDNFKLNNIKELIVDLRYNSGGDAFLAHQLANYIVPLSENHKMFFRFINNKKYSTLNYSLYLEAKSENLNLERVFFITSPESESSNETLINSLQAVMQVKVVGTQSHGKPFGFLPIAIGDFYIFPVAFTTINANGYGEYYDGIPVDFEVEDDVTHDFGDPDESCVQSILKYISSGQFPTSGKKGGRQNIERFSINENQIPAFMYISH